MRSARLKKALNTPMVQRAAGSAAGGPPTFIKGSGKKNLQAARTNPLGQPKERKARTHSRTALKQYMKSKVNGSLLDLSSLSTVPELIAAELTCNFNARTFVDLLFDIIAEEMPPIESLNISGNNISTLAPFRSCAEEHNQVTFIRNLNLSNNQLHSFKELDHLKPFKLAEIIMKGNPIASNKDYAKHVVTKLGSVEMVDHQNVAAVRTQLRPKLPPVAATFVFNGEGTREVLYAFCKKYFDALDEQLFDSDLLEAYSPDCYFTLTTDRGYTVGYGTRAEAITRNLREVSHNLCQLKTEAAPAKTVHRGRLETIKVLKEKVLGGMRTVHEITSFEVDAMQIAVSLQSPVITANVHGKVKFSVQLSGNEDKECSFERCFDRTFVLRAPPQDSPWPAVIINDMLHLRPLKESAVMKPVVDPTAPPDVDEARRTALAKVMSSMTKLTIEYAVMCLEAADWDLTRANQLYEERKESLPPDALKSS